MRTDMEKKVLEVFSILTGKNLVSENFSIIRKKQENIHKR